jgi:hypothetical protein
MRQIVNFEWQFPEDDEWQTLAAPSAEVAAPDRRAQRVGYSLLAVALLTIVGWLVVDRRGSEPPAEVTQMERPGQPVLVQETKQGQNDTYNTAPALTMQIQVVEGEQRWAMVDVLAPPPSPAARQPASTLAAPGWMSHEMASQTQGAGPPFAYREMRFYQQTEQGWQRIEPPVALWGEPGVLETAHLRFVFRSLDRATVERVAAESEVLYTDLHRLLGLPPAHGESVTFEVVPRAVVGDWLRRDQRLLVPSPLLLRIPIDASRSTVLGQRIRAALSYAVVQEAMQQPLARRQRQPMIDGLWRWLRETDTLPFPLPAALTRTEQTSFLPDVLPKLSQLQVLLGPDWIDDSRHEPQIATAQMLIEYIVATYGAESRAAVERGCWAPTDISKIRPRV